MYLKLKNVERTFNVDAPMERSVKGAEKYFWVISFNVKEHLTTEEVEKYFTPENTAEITFVTPLPNGTDYEYTVTGYTTKTFGIIKHSADGSCAIDLQFSKEAGATDEGSVISNG